MITAKFFKKNRKVYFFQILFGTGTICEFTSYDTLEIIYYEVFCVKRHVCCLFCFAGNAILTNQGSNNKPATAPPPPPTVHHPKTHAPPPTKMNRPSIEDKVTTRKTTAQMGKNPTAATSSTQQPTSKKKTLYTSVFQSTHLPTSKFVL